MSCNDYIVETNNLKSGYGKALILNDVDVGIKRDCINVIIGPNGSGKTTLLRSIMNTADVFQGKVFFKDQEITDIPPHEIRRRGLACCPQEKNTFSDLTVKENLQMGSYLFERGELENRMPEVFEMFPILKDYKDKKVKFLSGGERQMLVLAIATIVEPEVILMDEPSANLAPGLCSKIFSKCKELKDKHGITLAIVEQNVEEILSLSERAILLVGGEVEYEGDAKSLLENPELGKRFLGM